MKTTADFYQSHACKTFSNFPKPASILKLLHLGAFLFALLFLAAMPAKAADCSGQPTDWSTLQSAFAAVTSTNNATIVLCFDLTDGSNNGQLAVANGATITFDLNGHDLSIENPGNVDTVKASAGNAAIAVPGNASLIIQDTSDGSGGTLTVTGGSSTHSGGGSGIGGRGGNSGFIAGNGGSDGSVTLKSGTVTATGGSGGSQSGDGSGIGGGGGGSGSGGFGSSAGNGGRGSAVTLSGGTLTASSIGGGGGGHGDIGGSGGAGGSLTIEAQAPTSLPNFPTANGGGNGDDGTAATPSSDSSKPYFWQGENPDASTVKITVSHNEFIGTTIPNSGSGATATASFTGGGNACSFDTGGTAFIAKPAALPAEFDMPQGAFQFTLTGCDMGSTVTMTVSWPQPIGSQYRKWGKATSTATSDSLYTPDNLTTSGNSVTFTVTDGALGDDDWTADGTITDPSGPLASNAPTTGNPATIPSLDKLALALLALLLTGFGFIVQRRFTAT